MDFLRKFFEAMHRQAQQKPQQPTPMPVVVGRLTDEEVLAYRQLGVVEGEMKDLARQAHVKKLELNYRMEAFYTSLRTRLGISFASLTNVTEDFLVEIPRDEAAKHGVISE